jgi:hypothetical protein
MECSSKDNYNITELFKTLLSLSKIIPTENHEPNGGPLKRRSSAYVSATSKGWWLIACLMFFVFLKNAKGILNFNNSNSTPKRKQKT